MMFLQNKRVTLSSVSQDRSLDATSPRQGVASPTTKGLCPTHTGVTIQSGVVSNPKGIRPTHTGVKRITSRSSSQMLFTAAQKFIMRGRNGSYSVRGVVQTGFRVNRALPIMLVLVACLCPTVAVVFSTTYSHDRATLHTEFKTLRQSVIRNNPQCEGCFRNTNARYKCDKGGCCRKFCRMCIDKLIPVIPLSASTQSKRESDDAFQRSVDIKANEQAKQVIAQLRTTGKSRIKIGVQILNLMDESELNGNIILCRAQECASSDTRAHYAEEGSGRKY